MMMDGRNKQCEMIVHACKKAGYERKHESDKKLWKNCLMPILMGKTVKGVDVDPSDVASCKKYKVEKMQMKLKQLQSN